MSECKSWCILADAHMGPCLREVSAGVVTSQAPYYEQALAAGYGPIDAQEQAERLEALADPPAVDGTGGALNAEGNRSNVGKLPWHLLPWDAVEEVVRVLAFGANKYYARCWEEKPLSWVETCASMTRHTVRFLLGEDRDKETGLHHMAHAACNAIFLVAYALRGVTVKDDRGPRPPALQCIGG